MDRHHSESAISESAVTDSVLTLVGRWAWGPCNAVAAYGDYALIGNGPTLQILDMADPTSPVIVSEYLSDGGLSDVQVKDSLAFVCVGDSLVVLRISNPEVPTVVGGVFVPGSAERVRLSDSMAYVLGSGGVLQVVDISNPIQPRLRGSTYAGGLNFGESAFAAGDGYVYVGSVELCPCGIDVVDVRDPDNPARISRFFTKGVIGTSAAIVQDSLLLVGVLGGSYGLEVYNIAIPSLPRFRGGIAGLPSAKGIVPLSGFQVFLTAGPWVLAADVSDAGVPKVRGRVDAAEAPMMAGSKLALSQTFVFSAYSSALLTVDRSDIDTLKELSFFRTGGWSVRIALRDTLAFIASDYAGLWIVDIADVGKPTGLGNVYTGGFAWDLAVSGQYAYLMNWPAYSAGDTAKGLWIIDISDVHHPRVISHYTGIVRYSSQTVPNTIAKSGNLVFITQNWTTGDDQIIEIVDVADPANPHQVSVIHGNYSPFDVAVKDTMMFIASPDSGLIAFDVSNPSNPKEVGRLVMFPTCVALKDTLAFAFTGIFWAVDIFDPYSMQILGSTNAGHGISAPDLAVSGNFAYWADRTGGAVDISDPRNPKQVATFQGRDDGHGVAAREDLLFYADQAAGMWIWRNNLVTSVGPKMNEPLPAEYQLLQNFPNPFNGGTVIEFVAPHKSIVKLEIFNILGQRIATLLNGPVDPGRHAVNFWPERVSSGTYFYRLTTETGTSTRAMLYLK